MHRGLWLVACTLGLLLSSIVGAEQPGSQGQPGENAAKPGYAVILVDGSVIPSKSKPLSAFGSFRFVNATGRTRVLPVSRVDLEATRAANADVPDDPSRGTLTIGGAAAVQPPPMEIDHEKAREEPQPKSVTVYSATWCGYCKDLKKYLAARNIPATIIEVDRLPKKEQDVATATMQRMTGRVSYPTVIIGGEVQAGFSKKWIESKMNP